MANCYDNPVEAIELSYPLLVERYELMPESGGAGAYRGGLGIRKEIIEAEGDGYVSLCPELDIASQGDSIEQARDNLREALELFFECASEAEVQLRLRGDVYVTQVEVATG
jgi:predicted RNase H-like HicB family nuclease